MSGIWSEFLLNKVNNIANNYSSNNIGLFFLKTIYHNCRSPPPNNSKRLNY